MDLQASSFCWLDAQKSDVWVSTHASFVAGPRGMHLQIWLNSLFIRDDEDLQYIMCISWLTMIENHDLEMPLSITTRLVWRFCTRWASFLYTILTNPNTIQAANMQLNDWVQSNLGCQVEEQSEAFHARLVKSRRKSQSFAFQFRKQINISDYARIDLTFIKHGLRKCNLKY